MLDLAASRRKQAVIRLTTILFASGRDRFVARRNKGYLRLFALYRAIEASKDGKAPQELRDLVDDFPLRNHTLVSASLKAGFPLKKAEEAQPAPPPMARPGQPPILSEIGVLSSQRVLRRAVMWPDCSGSEERKPQEGPSPFKGFRDAETGDLAHILKDAGGFFRLRSSSPPCGGVLHGGRPLVLLRAQKSASRRARNLYEWQTLPPLATLCVSELSQRRRLEMHGAHIFLCWLPPFPVCLSISATAFAPRQTAPAGQGPAPGSDVGNLRTVGQIIVHPRGEEGSRPRPWFTGQRVGDMARVGNDGVARCWVRALGVSPAWKPRACARRPVAAPCLFPSAKRPALSLDHAPVIPVRDRGHPGQRLDGPAFRWAAAPSLVKCKAIGGCLQVSVFRWRAPAPAGLTSIAQRNRCPLAQYNARARRAASRSAGVELMGFSPEAPWVSRSWRPMGRAFFLCRCRSQWRRYSQAAWSSRDFRSRLGGAAVVAAGRQAMTLASHHDDTKRTKHARHGPTTPCKPRLRWSHHRVDRSWSRTR